MIIILKLKVNRVFKLTFYLYLIVITINEVFNIFDYFITFGFGLFISVFLVFLLYSYIKKNKSKNIKIFVIFFIIMFFGSLNLLISSKSFGFLNSILFTFVNLSFAYIYVHFERELKGIKVLFWLITGYFFYFIIFGLDPNEALVAHSRNYISVYYLLISILYYIEEYKFSKKIKFVPSAFFLIVCIWAFGRTSVFVGIVFFIGIIFLEFKLNIKKATLIVLTVLVTILILDYIGVFSNYVNYALQRFMEKSVKGDPRFLILNNYISNITASSFLTGFNVNNKQHLFLGYGQPHNSFIEMHYRYGVWSLFKIIIVVFGLIKSFFTKKLIFLFLFLILFRSFFDIMIFSPDQFDFVIYIVIYYAFSNSNI